MKVNISINDLKWFLCLQRNISLLSKDILTNVKFQSLQVFSFLSSIASETTGRLLLSLFFINFKNFSRRLTRERWWLFSVNTPPAHTNISGWLCGWNHRGLYPYGPKMCISLPKFFFFYSAILSLPLPLTSFYSLFSKTFLFWNKYSQEASKIVQRGLMYHSVSFTPVYEKYKTQEINIALCIVSYCFGTHDLFNHQHNQDTKLFHPHKDLLCVILL